MSQANLSASQHEPEDSVASEGTDDLPTTSASSGASIVSPASVEGLPRFFARFHHADARDRIGFALVISVAAGIIFPYLGTIGFFDPWESHYAEVARQMAARDDYLYPFWKDSYFFSKPILLFWLTGPLYALIGAGDAKGELPQLLELCGRLPIALIGMLTLSLAYFAARRLWGLRAAVLSGLVLTTTPYFSHMSRQAITDMLYVGPMSGAICLLAVAFLDDDTREKLKNAHIPFWLLAIFAAILFPQLWEIGRTGAFLNRVTWLGSEFATRIAFSFVLIAIAAGLLGLLRKKGRDPLVHAAAALVALATLGKGPHAVALTGAVVFFYLVASGEWRLLKRPALITGTILFLCLAMPWYVTMFFFEGLDKSRKTWFKRFVMYDLLGRVGGGVHGNRGTHEYYVRYFSFGIFPWSGFFPVAVFSALNRGFSGIKNKTKSEKFDLYVVIWAVFLFVFFSFTTTKFHHYIFPLTIPAALIIGRQLDKWVSSKSFIPLGVIIVALSAVGLVARDFAVEPWQITDLYTYHYVSYKPKYYFPSDVAWRVFFGVSGGVIVAMVVAALFFDRVGVFNKVPSAILAGQKASKNAATVLLLVVSSIIFTIGSVQYYQANMSQHWSHRWIVKTYYQLRKPGEPLISYQMDWKGETLYAHNQEIQIKKKAAKLKKQIEKPGREFVIVQQDRFKRLKSAVGAKYADKLTIVDKSNKKWYLVLVDE